MYPYQHPNAAELFDRFDQELLGSVIPFWEKYSPDHQNGGFYNCLDQDGSLFDRRKHIWLQGRETWMFSKLYTSVEQRPEWLKMARLGADFLMKHAIRSDGRVYFSMTEDGKPMSIQRKIFSECFWIMAMAEFSRATGDDSYMQRAKQEFDLVWEWSSDLSKVGQLSYEGNPPAQSLAIPMILLNLIEEVAGEEWSEYSTEIEECIRRMLLHVDHEKQVVYETVSPSGEALEGYDGRLLNPGHAIEAGWFLQHWAQRLQRPKLSEVAINMVRWSFDKGWDSEYGGIFYFLDAEGFTPTQLEWDMKLWWPHCEAMYAHLLNYRITGAEEDLDRFDRTFEWTFAHFPDSTYGEWFGYLNRRGEVTHRFKGGPYKGCFHVPRALWLCRKILKES